MRHRTLVVLFLAIAVGLVLSWWMLAGPRSEQTPSDPAASAGPERVVLFGPNLNEMASVLGHADRIVAITDYCRWPAEILDRPRVGGQLDPDLEALALLRPDLLVIQGESPILRSFAAAQDVAVADLKMDDDVESILAGAVRLDRILGGDGTRGLAVADSLRAELDALAAHADAGRRPAALFVVSRDPGSVAGLFTAGAGTFLDDLLSIAGAANWAHDLGEGYFEVSLETLVATPPDVVFELRSAAISDDAIARVWGRALEPTPEVHVLALDGVLVPGPRIVDTARAMARALEATP